MDGVSRGMGGASRATTVLTGGLSAAVESPYQMVDSSVLDQTAPHGTQEAQGEPQEAGPQESSFDINDSVLC
jgi:hypothetical protein